MIDSFSNIPRGQTDLVFAIRSQKGAYFPSCDAQATACGCIYDIDAGATVHNASQDFCVLYEHFDGRVLVVHDSRACRRFNEICGDRYLGCVVHPCFQSVKKAGNHVEQLSHCECNWAVREDLLDWVHLRCCFLRGYLGCALLPHAFYIRLSPH